MVMPLETGEIVPEMVAVVVDVSPDAASTVSEWLIDAAA